MLITRESAKIREIESILINNGIIICPAFTLYGFSASLFSFIANKKIYNLKRRQPLKPFIVIANKDFILSVAKATDLHILDFLLNNVFTIVIKTKYKFPPYASINSKTAFRLANTPFLKEICKKSPITSTSVNVSETRKAYSMTEMIKAYKNRVDGIVIGNVVGKQSTIVELSPTGIKVLRKGFNSEKLKEVSLWLKSQKG